MRHFLIFPLIILPLFALTTIAVIFLNRTQTKNSSILSSINLPIPTPTPIDIYTPPNLPDKESYTLLFVGDSMTEALGPNLDQVGIQLEKNYPNKTFGLFNYGFGSTNILSISDRLHQPTTYLDQKYPAILDRQFDIIFLESMGYNPLSEYSLDAGLQKQTAALDQATLDIVSTHPEALVIFVATITPSTTHFGKQTLDLTPLVRTQWVNERRAYIENHINYAIRHQYPLVDAYHHSQDANGQAILEYINHDDYIHPSAQGLVFIAKEINDYLTSNKIIPQ